MSDAPSNLPFDPLDEVPTTPPALPSASMPPSSSGVPLAEPIVPPARPVPPVADIPSRPPAPPSPPPVAPTAPAAPLAPRPAPPAVEDVFAGIETAPAPQRATATAPVLPPPSSGGHHSSLLLVLVSALVLACAGGATWWYVFRSPEAPAVSAPVTNQGAPILPPPAQEPTIFDATNGDVPIQIVPLPEPVTTPPAGAAIPLPGTLPVTDAPSMPTAPQDMPIASSSAPSTPAVQFDTDGDGLTDAREEELGTIVLRFDSDNDTLGDGQEVTQYGTNPLNADTDGDGFPDGVEIQNGFNPRGTGRCTQPDCRL